MNQLTRRERMRAETETEIRRCARRMLVEEGKEAVTLRAIARELGITAPALYRYYDSREALLRQLCDDICTDLSTELSRHFDAPGNDYLTKVFTVCREFRAWALAHTREFTLVFATPPEETRGAGADRDRFADVFLGTVGPLMAEGVVWIQPEPTELVSNIDAERDALASAFSAQGIEVPSEALRPEAVYGLLRWWVRLYGHVALEVFGRFPFDLPEADRLFEILLAELARDIGFPGDESTG